MAPTRQRSQRFSRVVLFFKCLVLDQTSWDAKEVGAQEDAIKDRDKVAVVKMSTHRLTV